MFHAHISIQPRDLPFQITFSKSFHISSLADRPVGDLHCLEGQRHRSQLKDGELSDVCPVMKGSSSYRGEAHSYGGTCG